MNRKRWFWTAILFAACFTVSTAAGLQWKGSFYTEGYGYKMLDNAGASKDHVWLFSGLNSTINNLPGGWRFYSHVQYRGDNVDKFSTSAQTRLYAANLSYGDYGSPWEINLGRFFLYRGVAIGTMDGMEVSRDWNKAGFTVFGGTNGPTNRGFELAKGSSPYYGAELRYRSSCKWMADDEVWKLSYADQTRNGDLYRRLIGLQVYDRLNRNWTLLGTAQYRLMSNDLRQFSLRARYYSPQLVAYVEGGMVAPEIAANSWFSDFELPTMSRIRAAADYYFVPAKWAAGFEGTMTVTEGANGFRGGPVVTTPYGQAGYRIASGDLSQAKGPWFSAFYHYAERLDLYANTSIVDYSWDGAKLAKGQVTTAGVGGRYTPQQFDWMTLGGEFQYYKTPQLTSDRRALGSITFRFATGGGK